MFFQHISNSVCSVVVPVPRMWCTSIRTGLNFSVAFVEIFYKACALLNFLILLWNYCDYSWRVPLILKKHIIAFLLMCVRASLHMRREEKPTRCHWMLYCTFDMLNMFRALLCPLSGARDYTGCNRRNVRDFVRVFLRSNHTDITQNTYIQSWTVTEIMAIEMCGLLECRTYCTPSVMSYLSNAPARQRDMVMKWPWRVRYSQLRLAVKYLEV